MSRRCRGRGDSSGSSISQRREVAMRRVMAGGRATACPRHGLAAGCRGAGAEEEASCLSGRMRRGSETEVRR